MKIYNLRENDEYLGEAPTTPFVRYEEAQAEINALKAELALAKELLEDWRDAVTIPRTNCSCHISAPCNDCYEWASLRETAEHTDRLLGVKP